MRKIRSFLKQIRRPLAYWAAICLLAVVAGQLGEHLWGDDWNTPVWFAVFVGSYIWCGWTGRLDPQRPSSDS